MFLDYDGTLREFEDEPLAAIPEQALLNLLSSLCDLKEKIKTVIISGRDSNFLATYLGQFPAITLVAEHGYLIKRAYEDDWRLLTPPSPENKSLGTDWKEVVYEQMKKVAHIPGSFVEEKAKSVVWHYRAVKDEQAGEDGAE